jgi:hypothetical protein
VNSFGPFRIALLFAIEARCAERGLTFAGPVEASRNARGDEPIAMFILHRTTSHEALDPLKTTVAESIVPKFKFFLWAGEVCVGRIVNQGRGFALGAASSS